MTLQAETISQERDSYLRVTTILQKQMHQEFRSIPLERLAIAALRGTAVHNYCTIYMRDLFMPEIEEEYLPYVEAFVLWADAHIKKVILTATRLYDDDLKISGEPDALVILQDSDVPTLIDIKATCMESKSWPLQLHAYQHLCKKNGLEVGRVMNLHLKKSMRSKTEIIQGEKVRVSHPVISAKDVLPRIDFNQSWNIFSSALTCYNYFDKKEEKECSPTNPR